MPSQIPRRRRIARVDLLYEFEAVGLEAISGGIFRAQAVQRGEVVAEAALVDRSAGSADLGVPFYPLIRIDVPTYEADSVPPALAAIPAVKPGSRAAA